MGYSPWVSQARILEWAAISFSRASSPLRDGTHISCTAGRFITTEPPGKPRKSIKSRQRDMKATAEGSEQSGKQTPAQAT